MKVLFKKLKKASKPLLIFFIICLVIYIVSLVFLTINILSLSGIETLIRICALILFYLFLFGYLIGGLICIITKRKKTMIFLSIILLLLSALFGLISYYINITYSKVDTISKKYVTYTSNLIAMQDTDEDDIQSIGMISNEDDIEGYVLAQKIIEQENIDEDCIEYFDDYYEMLTNMYAGELDAVFITSNYAVSFSSEDLFANIAYDVKVIYEYSQQMENQDISSTEVSTKKLTEPFSILLLGVDSEKDGLDANQAFNGDTLMLITFNPNTLNATIFSIPRDTYVPIACRNGAENKINSAAAYGTSCVIDTIEDLTDIDIDYYVKVNFKGVVDLVDALGGIEVDVPMTFCEQDSNRLFGDNEICLEEGLQVLDGEGALALARHRKTLPLGDFQRIQNQQLVVEAIAKKAKTLSSVSDFYEVLDTISKNIDTNMSTNTMLSFYNVFKKMLTTSLSGENDFITIDKTYLTGSDLTLYNSATRMNMYTFQYSRDSLASIIKLMKVNLELEDPDMVTTFSFSINETYEQTITGSDGGSSTYTPEGATTTTDEEEDEEDEEEVEDETTITLMPNLVGEYLSTAQSWAKTNGISLSVSYIYENNSLYDESYDNNQIIYQSITANTDISNISSVSISVIQKTDTQDDTNPKADEDSSSEGPSSTEPNDDGENT